MTETKDLIIITASCGKNLELSEKFLEKSNELKISSEILDLTIWYGITILCFLSGIYWGLSINILIKKFIYCP